MLTLLEFPRASERLKGTVSGQSRFEITVKSNAKALFPLHA